MDPWPEKFSHWGYWESLMDVHCNGDQCLLPCAISGMHSIALIRMRWLTPYLFLIFGTFSLIHIICLFMFIPSYGDRVAQQLPPLLNGLVRIDKYHDLAINRRKVVVFMLLRLLRWVRWPLAYHSLPSSPPLTPPSIPFTKFPAFKACSLLRLATCHIDHDKFGCL